MRSPITVRMQRLAMKERWGTIAPAELKLLIQHRLATAKRPNERWKWERKYGLPPSGEAATVAEHERKLQAAGVADAGVVTHQDAPHNGTGRITIRMTGSPVEIDVAVADLGEVVEQLLKK